MAKGGESLRLFCALAATMTAASALTVLAVLLLSQSGWAATAIVTVKGSLSLSRNAKLTAARIFS